MLVDRHTHKSVFSTISDAHYKEKVFPDGEFLHATIKDVDQYIYCAHIKPKNIINMKYDLFFFNYFPEYIIPDEELDDGSNAP